MKEGKFKYISSLLKYILKYLISSTFNRCVWNNNICISPVVSVADPGSTKTKVSVPAYYWTIFSENYIKNEYVAPILGSATGYCTFSLSILVFACFFLRKMKSRVRHQPVSPSKIKVNANSTRRRLPPGTKGKPCNLPMQVKSIQGKNAKFTSFPSATTGRSLGNNASTKATTSWTTTSWVN